nr:uncharacterized protein c9e9.04 [Quercus suber]
MTLYYSLVFALLVFEMALFVTLIVPLPFKMKRAIFTFISENPLVAKLQYGLKITFIFITILFVDSVNRVYRVQVELAQAKYQGGAAAAVAGSERMEVQARKFYSQRNMYLCGFTLFLSLILNRTYVMILDVLRLEQENAQLKGEAPSNDKSSSKLGEAGGLGEIGTLKRKLGEKDKLLEAKDRDIETLRKQAKGMTDEYTRSTSTSDATPKKDR